MIANTLHHHLGGIGGQLGHDDMVAQQSKDAIIYVTVSHFIHLFHTAHPISCDGFQGCLSHSIIIVKEICSVSKKIVLHYILFSMHPFILAFVHKWAYLCFFKSMLVYVTACPNQLQYGLNLWLNSCWKSTSCMCGVKQSLNTVNNWNAFQSCCFFILTWSWIECIDYEKSPICLSSKVSYPKI